MNSPAFSRRAFLQTTSAAAAGVMLQSQNAAAAPATAERFPIITFTKPFQNVGYERTAEILEQIGWSGVECPVRTKGQIEPAKVEDELPKLAEALQKRGRTLTLVTTDVKQVDPLGERVLRTAAKLGVKRYRLAFEKYDLTKPIPPQLANIKAKLKDLVALNKQLGLKGGIQNHSGRDYVGGPVWDVYELVHDLDPDHLGICFDIGHATLEGGLSWQIQAKLMEPFFTCVFVKDFHWEKGPKGWTTKWGPLGEGMVRKEFFDWLKKSAYTGPVCQHCEYLQGDGEAEMAAYKKDAATLRQWLG